METIYASVKEGNCYDMETLAKITKLVGSVPEPVKKGIPGTYYVNGSEIKIGSNNPNYNGIRRTIIEIEKENNK